MKKRLQRLDWWEGRLLNWMQAHILWLAGAVLLVASLLLRCKLFPFVSGDMENCLLRWYEAGSANGLDGLIAASNYNALYLFLFYFFIWLPLPLEPIFRIKLLSLLFEYFCIFSLVWIVRSLCPDERRRDFAAFAALAIGCFVPSFLLNASLWGQCDAGYAAFILWALFFWHKRHYCLSMFFLGLALCLKLQALFILPLFLLLYLCKKQGRLRHFLLPPLLLLASGLPLWPKHTSLLFPFTRYAEQTGDTPTALTSLYGNLYAFGSFESLSTIQIFSAIGYGLLLAVFACLAVWLVRHGFRFHTQPSDLFLLGAFCVLACCFFLPHMHERYAYVGELLLLGYCLLAGKPRHFLLALLVELSTLSTYLDYLFGLPLFSLVVSAGINLAVLCAVVGLFLSSQRERQAV